MEILAHRGLWQKSAEKNTIHALRSALEWGFGIETDIRDYQGILVINHDIADEKASCVEELFDVYKKLHTRQTMALNIKADGLQGLLKALLRKYDIENYFLFDMSIPELMINIKENLNFYTRRSDVESECVMLRRAKGVWLDGFFDYQWLNGSIINGYIAEGKEFGLISPEIHGLDCRGLWQMLRDEKLCEDEHIKLCTDKPKEAKEFFGL